MVARRYMTRGLTLLAALLVSVVLFAKEPPPVTPPAQPDESNLVEHGHYTNRAGREVHSPAHTKDGSVPAGASAQCRDGSYSFSQSRSGTCSRHGGVRSWLKG